MNVFDLFAKITLDDAEYNRDLDSSEKKTSKFGAALKKGLGATAKGVGIALGAAATAVSALTTAAVNSYGEYEQLKGGVETLFKDSADTILKYADNAYKTAGLSANQYMETVTSFSASLLQSLNGDTEAAAKKADQAIIDMSDNANKMGTSMESIQNAYSGFAKQNFTMLDNLKLGYGGTKEEMERLLADAQAISGIEYDVSSYADIVDAIHVVQEEMGITGVTALEAGTTIQGSVNSMKSAWSNLMLGLADDSQDFGALMDNFVTSLVGDGSESNLGVFGNILPRVMTTLDGVVKLVEGLAPSLLAILPGLVSTLLPELLTAAKSILQAIIDVLPQLTSAIMDFLPELIMAGVDIILALVEGITDMLPELMQQAVDLIINLANKLTEPDQLSRIIISAIELINAIIVGFGKAIPQLINAVPDIIKNIINAFVQNGPQMWEAAKSLLSNLSQGLINSIGTLLSNVNTYVTKPIINGIKNGFSAIGDVGKNLIQGLWNGISSVTDWIKEKISGFASGILSGIKDFFGIHSPSRVMAQVGSFMAEGLGIGWEDEYDNVKKDIQNGLAMSMDLSPMVNSGLTLAEQRTVSVNNTVVLEGEMADLFKALVKQNEQNTESTGRNAFAY